MENEEFEDELENSKETIEWGEEKSYFKIRHFDKNSFKKIDFFDTIHLDEKIQIRKIYKERRIKLYQIILMISILIIISLSFSLIYLQIRYENLEEVFILQNSLTFEQEEIIFPLSERLLTLSIEGISKENLDGFLVLQVDDNDLEIIRIDEFINPITKRIRDIYFPLRVNSYHTTSILYQKSLFNLHFRPVSILRRQWYYSDPILIEKIDTKDQTLILSFTNLMERELGIDILGCDIRFKMTPNEILEQEISFKCIKENEINFSVFDPKTKKSIVIIFKIDNGRGFLGE